MNIYPHVYRIDHPSGEFYIGSRCANRVPASQDFGSIYKTSTELLSYPFEEYNQTVLAEFFTYTAKTDAYNFEQALIYEHWGNPLMVNERCYHGKARFSRAGRVVSDDHKQKISEAKLGKKHTDETRAKMSEAKRGKTRKPFSAEHRARLSEVQRGKILTDETKQKISAARQSR